MNPVELRHRVEACQQYLSEHAIAAALVVSPANMFYLTGMSIVPFERLAAVLVGSEGNEGNVVAVLPELERERALEFMQPCQVMTWRDGDDPLAIVTQALRMLGVSRGAQLGVEKGSISLGLAERLQKVIPGVEFRDVSPFFARLRATKAEEEIACIREACRITMAAMEQAFAFIRPGVTELEVAARLDLALASAGATGTAFRTTVLSGVRSASPHGQSSRKEISRGDLVVIDVGAMYEGYCADLTRTVVVGRCDHQHLEMHELVLTAQQRALQCARPGVPAAAVDAAARSVIEEAGYGAAFMHRTGHGLGIEVHEPPSLSGDNHEELQEGMVFTVEPGVYIPSWAGVRIEDVVVLTETGVEVLTDMARDLITL